MHLRTVTEIGLHLQSFRNIQLWYQGVYFLKFTIYQQKPNNKKVNAQPYAITQTNIVGQQVQRTYDSQIVGLSSIVKNESAFYTKAFHLRYFQQQVEIGDICRWRLQMGTFNKQQNHGIFQQKKGNQNNKQLTIEIGLYFYDSYKKQLNQTINDWRTNSKEVRQMKMKIPVKCMQPQLINSYMPILFTDQYFSLSSSSLHLMTIDYKFRMNQVSLSQFASWSEQERKKKIKEMMMIKRNDVNIQGVNGNNMSRRGGLIVGYMKLKTGAESERKLVENMVEWLKSLQRLSQDIVKQYRRVYEFVMTEDLNLHPKIKHILQPQQVQQSLIHVKQLVKQQQRNLKDRKQVSTRQVNYEDVLMTMFNKISYIGQRNLQVFHDLINLIKLNSIFSIRLYSPQYYQKQKSFYQKLAKFDLINNINHNPSNKQQKRHDITLSNNHHKNKLIKQLQNQRSSIKINTLVYNQKLKTHINQLPLLILQKYTSKTSLENNPSKKINNLTKSGSEFTGIHLIVLVHGFQGTSYDMKLIKNHLSHLYPESMFLCCTSNQDRTDGDLFQMGNRLAVQIKAFILQNFNYNNISTSSTNGLMLSKISFIGHSLGGLKIRAALPKLLEYKNMFQNFITLSSPHLGYNVNTSSVVDAGLWVLQKIKDSQCLRQLKMDDEQNLYDTTLYKLSQQQGLQHFKRVFLFSSSQDSYAPYESARIQIDPQFVDHSDKVKTVHCQMVRNILKNVREQSLHRVDVNFTINTKNLDALIGRTAHILFLQNAEVIKIFSYLYQGIFS